MKRVVGLALMVAVLGTLFVTSVGAITRRTGGPAGRINPMRTRAPRIIKPVAGYKVQIVRFSNTTGL